MENIARDPGGSRPAWQCLSRRTIGVLLACCAGLAPGIALSAANTVGDEFFDYYTEPCEVGPAALVQAPYNWTVQEVIDYNVICAGVFSGSFTSADNYSSTSGVGSISATTSSAEAMARQKSDSIQDRLDELQDEESPSAGFGLLLSAQAGETEREETEREQGYDSDLESLVIGLDYRFDDALVIGAAYAMTRDDTAYDGDSGELETESQSLMGYFTYLVGDAGYINGYVGVAPLEYDNERNFSIEGPNVTDAGTGTVTASYDGDQTMAGIGGGYDWYPGNYSVGVFANFDYSETEIDGYEEQGDTNFELIYPEQRSRSAPISLGVNGSFVVDMGWASLIPNASLAAVYETQQDSRSFAARLKLMPEDHPTEFILETDDPDREYGIATLGAVIATHSGTQLFLTYEQLLWHDFYDTWSLTAGVLVEF